jgi:hypothetical protein
VPNRQFTIVQMWEQARSSAARGASLAAALDHDFAFVPAAYSLLFYITVGCQGQSFALAEVKMLLADIERSEGRLTSWGMIDHVVFDCHPRRWLIALRAEWKKHTGEGSVGGKSTGGSSKKKQRPTIADVLEEPAAPLPEGHIPVTDWRVLDQRFYGFYTWLEPPMQKADVPCAMCERPCERIHRCALRCS